MRHRSAGWCAPPVCLPCSRLASLLAIVPALRCSLNPRHPIAIDALQSQLAIPLTATPLPHFLALDADVQIADKEASVATAHAHRLQ